MIFRKIQERKKFLEPQVLRIADDDDLLENDLEVDESDEENNYEKHSNYSPEGLSYYLFVVFFWTISSNLTTRTNYGNFIEITLFWP